jgi:hypothetical protein
MPTAGAGIKKSSRPFSSGRLHIIAFFCDQTKRTALTFSGGQMDPYYATVALLLTCTGVGTAIFAASCRNADPARARDYTVIFVVLFSASGLLLGISLAMYFGYL